MALLFIDGFDHTGTSTGALVDKGKWGSIVGTNTLGTSTTRFRTGTGSALAPSTAYSAVTKALPASGGCIVGVAVYPELLSNATFIRIREGTTDHLTVALTTAGVLTVQRGATVLNTGASLIPANAWSYLEFKGVIDDAVGSYELRINGVTELSASGIDTRNGGTTGQWDRVAIGGLSSGDDSYLDDFYVCDTSGATRNDFLGPCKVETIYPQTDAVAAGSNAGLTPSTGTDHGALVDETTPNTSDYNSSATVGVKDTYNYASLTLTGTILGVQTNLYAAKSDAAARTVCAIVRAGGTDYDGANVSPTTTFSYFSEVRAQNPNTSADWTSGDLTNLEAGMKVTA